MSSELDTFREQWLAEVRSRNKLHPEPLDKLPKQDGPKLQSALDYYRLAVDYETRGKFQDALQLYRRAFKLDNNVDRLYHKHIAATDSPAQHKAVVDDRPPVGEPALDKELAAAPISAIIDHLIQLPLRYEPEDDKREVILARLPDEVMARVLAELALAGDTASLERVALVNRKLRMVTLDSSIWRSLALAVLIAPQVADEHARLDLFKRYKFDFRRLWIEHPRVRLDGVYISLCHYLRHGQSDSPWYQPQHLITYHRYLRFFPDGRVLMLLANGESSPRDVVSKLTPQLKLDGVSMGNWTLNGAVISVTDLTPVAGKQTRYCFAMTLVVKGRPMGRWNKLDFVEYSSIHLETGDVEPLPMRNERAFHFSKVKRYGLGTEMPKDSGEDVGEALAAILRGTHIQTLGAHP